MSEEQRGSAAPPDALTHARARALVSAAWDGETTATELRALAAHLARCPECAAAARSMRDLLGRIEDLLCDP